MSNIKQTAKKSMLVVGTILLAGCVTAPTLDFSIPKDKINAFNDCMVPVPLETLGKNKDYKEFWRNDLSDFKPTKLIKPALLTHLSESIPEILNMLYADKERLNVPEGKELLSVPFDMNEQRFPFSNSKMIDVIKKVYGPAIFSLLLQPESKFKEVETTIPRRTAKALHTYLLAYFTVSQDTEEKNGFISRDGTKFQFPVEINSISRNKIQAISSVDHSQVGADIIRIFLEAIRDGSLDECEALPAIDKSATGVKAKLLRLYADDRDNTNTICDRKWGVTLERLSIIQTRANAAESMIATASGKAMRGGSMGSLGNEALARAAETAIGVMARHTTERVEWCRANL